MSIYLTGSNSLVEDLRAATAIELYLNSSFYSHHPYIVSLSQNYPNIFRCPENVLMMSVSQKSIDSNKKLSDLVKEEAINICENKIWSSFLCILALASVRSRKINCYFLTEAVFVIELCSIAYRTMFNCITQSRIPQMSEEEIHILFSYEGVWRSSTFQHNHYVLIIFHAEKKPALKRQNLSLNKKGEKKVFLKVDLNSQNIQKDCHFLKFLKSIHQKNQSTSQVINHKY